MNLPILDVPTRWNSAFNMLERLIDLKDFCNEMEDENPDVKIMEIAWDSMKTLCASLKPLSEATIKMQAERLTYSEFYGIWVMCRKKLEALSSKSAKLFLTAMVKREQKILNSEVLLSCVFLDPRVNFFLTPSEIFKAKRHLSVLWTHNSSLNNKIVDNEKSDSEDLEVEEIQENLNEYDKMLQMEAAKTKKKTQLRK